MCNQNQNLIIPLQRFLKCGVECEMWMKLDVDQGQPTNKKKTIVEAKKYLWDKNSTFRQTLGFPSSSFLAVSSTICCCRSYMA